MIGRLAGLFRRYASRHASVVWPGFALHGSDGQLLGYIDHVSVGDGRLSVQGWALSDVVGLAHAKDTKERVPHLPREDVVSHYKLAPSLKPGFVIDIPASFEHTVFWIQTDDGKLIFNLPQVTPVVLRHMKRRQVLPFLRDLLRASPAALRWFVRRDPRAVAQVKTILGLNTVVRSGALNSLLFRQDVDVADTAPDGLMQTPITIVVPIYNAFDLLPEVLDRVLTHTDLPWRLILIEDCSSDAQVRPWLRDWVQGLEPDHQARVQLIENDKNLGFIRSVNRAFEAALDYGDHVVLLNSDAFVPAGWASRLIRPLLDHRNVATVTPMSNDAEIFTAPVICQREILTPGEADAIDQVAAQFFPGPALADAPTGVGFCMAMHIDYLKMLPSLDTSFGRGYGEEVDWCQRARARGGRHLGLGGLFVEHRGGTSFGSEEKLKLVQKNNATIAKRYPSYDQEVQTFIRHDPLNSPRLALALAWAAQRQKGRVPVYLAHDLGGGAEHYLQKRISEDVQRDAAAVVLRVGGVQRWQVELHTANGVSRGQTDETWFVKRLLDLLPRRDVIYSCAVGDADMVELPDILRELGAGPEDRLEVLIHDFLPLSPSYTLLGSEGDFRGVPVADGNSDPAHQTIRPDGTIVTLSQWRAAWGELMEAAAQVTVFSQNSKGLVLDAYPNIADRIAVVPHKIWSPVPNVAPGKAEDGVPVIGVLGNIGLHKGAAILRDLTARLADTGQARIVVIGNVDPAFPLTAPSVMHGDYKVSDIPALVARYGIESWLIPSIWPETFSYTTHEAIATGLPVWCFDMGAQGDTVSAAAQQNAKGGTLSLPTSNADTDEMIRKVLDLTGKEDT